MVKGDRGYQESGLLYFYLGAWLLEIKAFSGNFWHFQAGGGSKHAEVCQFSNPLDIFFSNAIQLVYPTLVDPISCLDGVI